ncbi:MAG: hypothetical protein R2697_17510 [Ilumatobacteraceae bacterium]
MSDGIEYGRRPSASDRFATTSRAGSSGRRLAVRVTGGAAVAEGHVQVAVGAERQVAGVVIGVGLRDLEHDAGGRRIEHPVGADRVLGDGRGAVGGRVIRSVCAVGGELESEQACSPDEISPLTSSVTVDEPVAGSNRTTVPD